MVDMVVLKRRAETARAWLEARWADFRAESLYFQARVGVLAAYAVVVVLTVLIAPPSKVPWRCVEDRITFGLSFKTIVEVTNVDNGELEDVLFEVKGTGVEYDGKRISGTWRTKPLTLEEGKKYTLLTEQLFDERGISPPFSLELQEVTVLEEDGERIAQLQCEPKNPKK